MSIASLVAGISFFQPQNDDDEIDRANYYYTSTGLMLSVMLFSFKIFTGRVMECWVPAEYQKGWEDYAEMYCWARNTYYVPWEEDIPGQLGRRDRAEISYYQWTPFFLLVSAFAFYFPCILWRSMNTKSGVRLRDIIEAAQDRTNVQPEHRQNTINGLGRHLLSIFRHQFRFGDKHFRGTHRYALCLNWRYYEAYMTIVYLGIKLLYLGNVMLQLILINWFLQTNDYHVYGYDVLYDLLRGKEWQESGNFPRVTMCDMKIRVLGNIQRHTVQCVLVINIFTEKLFIMLWIWYAVLTVFTLISLIKWTYMSFFYSQRFQFIKRRLELADRDFDASDYKFELNEFVRNWVKLDGVFVCRMITIHTSGMFCTELVDAMWDAYLEDLQAEDDKPTIAGDSHKGSKTGLPTSDTAISFKHAFADHISEETEDDASSVNTILTNTNVDTRGATGRPLLRRKNSVFHPLVMGGDQSPAIRTQPPSFARQPSVIRPMFTRGQSVVVNMDKKD